MLVAKIDPDTMWPPCITTIVPELASQNVTVAELSVVRLTLAGMIKS